MSMVPTINGGGSDVEVMVGWRMVVGAEIRQ